MTPVPELAAGISIFGASAQTSPPPAIFSVASVISLSSSKPFSLRVSPKSFSSSANLLLKAARPSIVVLSISLIRLVSSAWKFTLGTSGKSNASPSSPSFTSANAVSNAAAASDAAASILDKISFSKSAIFVDARLSSGLAPQRFGIVKFAILSPS